MPGKGIARGAEKEAIGRRRGLQRRAQLPIKAAANESNGVMSRIGLTGLAVMGQNLALNVAEKGFPISVYNRSPQKTDECCARATKEGLDGNLFGYKDIGEFVQSIAKPRVVIILVKAGKPVDATIDSLAEHMDEDDVIIDGGNEWFVNTERRAESLAQRGVHYMGMGVSGGEEGARNGPSMMPGGSNFAYERVQEVLRSVAAQVDDGPCVTYVGPGGAGNYVKMVHNGIEYGDMQLISEAYDILRTIGGLSNEEMAQVFEQWNDGELESFLVTITAEILRKEDDQVDDGSYLVDKILDKTGMKGTGKWTVQEAAEYSIPAPTIASAFDARCVSGRKEQRQQASKQYAALGLPVAGQRQSAGDNGKASSMSFSVDKNEFVSDVRNALFASKVCSYAQGFTILQAKSEEAGWKLSYEELARIWKGGCIIRAGYLDDIKQAFQRDPEVVNLLTDSHFAPSIASRSAAWRRVVSLAVMHGVAVPGMSNSLAYFDGYRREACPANLVQAQRDYFGSHTYERTDRDGAFHTVWSRANSADSITTTGYSN